jgi:hypothetical protein
MGRELVLAFATQPFAPGPVDALVILGIFIFAKFAALRAWVFRREGLDVGHSQMSAVHRITVFSRNRVCTTPLGFGNNKGQKGNGGLGYGKREEHEAIALRGCRFGDINAPPRAETT